MKYLWLGAMVAGFLIGSSMSSLFIISNKLSRIHFDLVTINETMKNIHLQIKLNRIDIGVNRIEQKLKELK